MLKLRRGISYNMPIKQYHAHHTVPCPSHMVPCLSHTTMPSHAVPRLLHTILFQSQMVPCPSHMVTCLSHVVPCPSHAVPCPSDSTMSVMKSWRLEFEFQTPKQRAWSHMLERKNRKVTRLRPPASLAKLVTSGLVGDQVHKKKKKKPCHGSLERPPSVVTALTILTEYQE